MRISKRLWNGVKNIDSVFEGIENFKNPTELVELVALERSKDCLNCEHFKDEPIEEFRVQDRIEVLSNKMCDLCGCISSYKLRTKIITTKNCPLKND